MTSELKNQYEIGDEIIFFWKEENRPIIAEIIEKNAVTPKIIVIKIFEKHDMYFHSFWIRIDNPHLALTKKQLLLNNSKIKVKFLKKTQLPTRLPFDHTKTMQDKSIIYSTHNGIVKYNFKSNEYSELDIWDSIPTRTFAMDYMNNTLFVAVTMLTGTSLSPGLYKSNLNTGNNELIRMTKIKPIGRRSFAPMKSLIIANGYHILTQKEYIYYDDLTETWSEPQRCQMRNISFIAKQNKIINFSKDKIFWEINTNLTEKKAPGPKLINKTLLKTPLWMKSVTNHVNIYDNLILVVYENNMAFLNLLSSKWYEVKIKFPILDYYERLKLINGKDNYVYFVIKKLYGSIMFKINCLDIIPKSLQESYATQKYKSQIFKFIKENYQKKNKSAYIPIVLQDLILSFYPCFLYFD